jgi:Ca2+-binding EF-hand superfamily protein
MSYRNGFILAAGLIALGAASAQAQDDRYRKTNDDSRYGDDGRLHKNDGVYDDDDYFYDDQDYRGQAGQMNSRLRGMDQNRDGRISRGEWCGNARAFDRRDRNRDGVLAGQELRANRNRNRNRTRTDDTRMDSLGNLDRNRDGVISRGEWTGNRNDFERLDRNRDGYLTSAEARNRY